MAQFAADVKKIRERARQHIEAGAVTEGYKADREQVTRVLNDVSQPRSSAYYATSATTTWRRE